MSEETKKKETIDDDSVKTEESTNNNNKPVKVIKKTGNKKSLLLLIVFVLLIVGVLVLNKYNMLDSLFSGELFSKTDISSEVNPATVIATVNDVSITRGELDKKIESVKKSLPEGAGDPTEDASFEMQLLDDLIDLKLLVSEAESKNYTVTDDEINAQRTLLVEQFGGEEELNNQLEKFGVTQDELLENMKNELLIKQLLSEETTIDDIVISDDELASTYESVIAGNDNAPSLEQASEMLKTQLINQKSADIVSVYLSGLRDKANIDIKL